MKIKVLGIMGSMRRNGNSAYLLEKALESAKATAPDVVETETITLIGKKNLGCISCFKCLSNGLNCILKEKDDLQPLFEKWWAADAIIYSFPLYHMGIPGQLKMFIDRLGMATLLENQMMVPKYLKAIGAIAQGESCFAGQENAILQIVQHALLTGNIPITGSGSECYIGVGGFTEHDLATDSLKKAEEEKKITAIEPINGSISLGKRVAETAILIRSGAAANKELLQKDPVYNFLLNKVENE